MRRGEGAPKPANWDALVAAATPGADPVQWAVEVGRYNQQLADAGLPSVQWPLRGRASMDRLSNESGQNG